MIKILHDSHKYLIIPQLIDQLSLYPKVLEQQRLLESQRRVQSQSALHLEEGVLELELISQGLQLFSLCHTRHIRELLGQVDDFLEQSLIRHVIQHQSEVIREVFTLPQAQLHCTAKHVHFFEFIRV